MAAGNGGNPAPPISQAQASSAPAGREADAIYQKDQAVARVVEPQINLEAGEITFAEVYNSDELLLPDECDFQRHRILVRKIGYSAKTEQRGRIMRDVKAEILGYREQ